ncbi:hypothetical protein V6N13_148443 [Hibiscus sabdariffa]
MMAHSPRSVCSGEKFVERNISLFDIGRVKLKKRMNTVPVRDQKHELTLPRNSYLEAIPEDKLFWKLIYSLLESWDSKKTVIIEAKNLKDLKLDELIGSLLTHELMSKHLIRDKEKKIKEQGINVNAIALKSSKCHHEDSSMEESSEEDDEMDYLVKNFTLFMKYEKEKSRHEPKKKKMEPQRVQSSSKRGSSSKKAYVATWSDEEDSTENEVALLCFVALQEGEDSRESNAYRYAVSVTVRTTWFRNHASRFRNLWVFEASNSYLSYRHSYPEYRYALHQKCRYYRFLIPNGSKTSQLSPTARYSIGTIKQASKYQDKTNASSYNINMIKICLSA